MALHQAVKAPSEPNFPILPSTLPPPRPYPLRNSLQLQGHFCPYPYSYLFQYQNSTSRKTLSKSREQTETLNTLANMLAVFDRTVAKCPEGLRLPEVQDGAKGGTVAALLNRFSAAHEGAVTVRLGEAAAMAFSTDKQNPFSPRLFASVDDIFCIFQGALGNIPLLKQQYGLGKNATEDIIVIEAYRSLRDRGPYPVDKAVRDFSGKFAFVLYDRSSNTIFIAADADGAVPFFWGRDSEDRLIVSDDVEIMKQHCGKHFVPFPKGCLLTSSGGLQSFEHPLSEVKPVPRVDSKGEVCGAMFLVDTKVKKETGMPRVGSDADWSINSIN